MRSEIIKQVREALNSIKDQKVEAKPEDIASLYEYLAKLKAQEKFIKAEVDETQKKIFKALGKAAPKKVRTEKGPLSLTGRAPAPKLADNYVPEVVRLIGAKKFIANASFSPTKLKKLAGETAYEEFVERGLIMPKEKNFYYSLRCGVCAH